MFESYLDQSNEISERVQEGGCPQVFVGRFRDPYFHKSPASGKTEVQKCNQAEEDTTTESQHSAQTVDYFQVEYARESVKRGTTTAGLKFKDGVVLVCDKRIVSRLIIPESIEKMFKIDNHIGIIPPVLLPMLDS